MSDKLKAYTVMEDSEGYSCVRFATNSATARREGANELDVEWEDIESCKRTPWADKYAPGPVPKMELLADGWQFPCHHCETRISHHRDDDDDELAPVEVGSSIYCCMECASRAWADGVGRRAAEAAMIELVTTKWPGITITQLHVYGTRLEPREPGFGMRSGVWFLFPGGKYTASWEFGNDTVGVAIADVDAWRAFAGKKDGAA